MKQENKSHIIASVGTIIVLILIFLLLWFIYIRKQEIVEDEGILVSFGEEMEMGGGRPDEKPYMPQDQSAPAESTPSPSTETIEEKTQETPSPVEVKDDPEEQKRKQEEIEADKKRKEKDEADRKKKEKEAQQTKNAQDLIKGKFGGNTESPDGANGSKTDNGSANHGNPLGHGTSNGNGWSLAGRALVNELPKPSNDFTQAGVVHVEIQVDCQGNVVKAVAQQGGGTTIGDKKTQQAAVDAAKRAHFNNIDDCNRLSIGYIDYKFVLN